MPAPLALTAYALPEWFVQPDAAWVARLREISPITDKLAHLRFRQRAPQPDWFDPAEPQWELYSCTPAAFVRPDRAAQFAKHWSELPVGEQRGRKAMVSNYQHWMWHTHGVEARRFWVLQGAWGGTAAQYTRRETRYLDASNAISEPIPLGFFPACPFDERAVRAILRRDRLKQMSDNLDALEKMDRPAALQAEDDAAEQVFRSTWLDWVYDTMQPQAEFMQSYLRSSESTQTLRPATRGEADAVAQWKDHWKEYGSVVGAGMVNTRHTQVAVL